MLGPEVLDLGVFSWKGCVCVRVRVCVEEELSKIRKSLIRWKRVFQAKEQKQETDAIEI